MIQYYRSSIIFSVLAVALGFYIGGPKAALIVAILGILETSVSFDNAVVNASVLKNWDQKWRDRFLVWGMPIAVFGMRFLFPVLIVSIVAHLSPAASVYLAVESPDKYKDILISVHHEIAAFGGIFLLMVFLKFFLDQHKDVHWISWLEKPLSAVGRLDMAEVVIALGVLTVAYNYVDVHEQSAFLVAGIAGLMTYIVADAIGSLVGGDEGDSAGPRIIKQGIGGFLYLELLDSTFSFDGVIAAFAITNDIFIIMIGLSVGAMFVRSMTLHLVAKGTLTHLIFLEHAAFWAIGALAILMFVGIVVEVPEVVTGLVGAIFIVLGVWHSVSHKRKTDLANA